MCLIQHCLFVSDSAFLAREKAKADAEYYTAAKSAEANRVKTHNALKKKKNRIWSNHSEILYVKIQAMVVILSFFYVISVNIIETVKTRIVWAV